MKFLSSLVVTMQEAKSYINTKIHFADNYQPICIEVLTCTYNQITI